MGGTIWTTAQPGSVKNNSKNNINEESLSIKLSNRQVKLQVLKDEYLSKKSDKSNPNSAKEKKAKCGQCEKNIAFTVYFLLILNYFKNFINQIILKEMLRMWRRLLCKLFYLFSQRSLTKTSNCFISKQLNK